MQCFVFTKGSGYKVSLLLIRLPVKKKGNNCLVPPVPIIAASTCTFSNLSLR